MSFLPIYSHILYGFFPPHTHREELFNTSLSIHIRSSIEILISFAHNNAHINSQNILPQNLFAKTLGTKLQENFRKESQCNVKVHIYSHFVYDPHDVQKQLSDKTGILWICKNSTWTLLSEMKIILKMKFYRFLKCPKVQPTPMNLSKSDTFKKINNLMNIVT